MFARDIVPNKATGLGAIAGGLSEYGLIVIVPISAIAAINLLARSFARGHEVRAVVAVISIGWNVLLLCLLGLFAWVVIANR